MHGITWVSTALALLCLLASPAIAAENDLGILALHRLFPCGLGTGNSVRTGSAAMGTTQTSPGETRPSGSLSRTPVVQPPPLSAGEKVRYYFRTTYGLQSFGFTAAGAGIRQAYGAVPEWGGGLEGYGKRYASSFGQKAIDGSIRISLQTLMREEPRHAASGQSGILSRTLHSASRTLIVRKDDGGTRPAYTRWAGAFSAAYISRQWHPKAYQTKCDYLVAGFTSIGLDAARNVWNEFLARYKEVAASQRHLSLLLPV
jgi:hypothetical protein